MALIGANPFGVLAAFGAGILSFLSPCVLPLVPGYLSMVSQLSIRNAPLTPEGASDGARKPKDHSLLFGIGLFILGFTIVFVLLGAAASVIGQDLIRHRSDLLPIAGWVVIAFGFLMLVTSFPPAVWTWLPRPLREAALWSQKERRLHFSRSKFGIGASFLMGVCFAFAWTPCIGPVLGSIVGLTAAKATLLGGVMLLFFYSLGLGLPFLLAGLLAGKLTEVLSRARKLGASLSLGTGFILVGFGSIVVAGKLPWLSSQFTTLLDHLGLERLTTS